MRHRSHHSFCVLLLMGAAGAQQQTQQMKGLAGAAVKPGGLQTCDQSSKQQPAGTMLTNIGWAGSSMTRSGLLETSRRTVAGRPGVQLELMVQLLFQVLGLLLVKAGLGWDVRRQHQLQRLLWRQCRA